MLYRAYGSKTPITSVVVVMYRREEPATRVCDDPPLDIVSIDNLPSVLALEASHAFAELLLPALLAYPEDKGWTEAKQVCGLGFFGCWRVVAGAEYASCVLAAPGSQLPG